jgi:hypothetical protein
MWGLWCAEWCWDRSVYGAQSDAGTGLFMVRRVVLGQVCRRPVPFPSASIIPCVLSIHLLPLEWTVISLNLASRIVNRDSSVVNRLLVEGTMDRGSIPEEARVFPPPEPLGLLWRHPVSSN